VAFSSFPIANTNLATRNITEIKRPSYGGKFSSSQPGCFFGYRQWIDGAVGWEFVWVLCARWFKQIFIILNDAVKG